MKVADLESDIYSVCVDFATVLGIDYYFPETQKETKAAIYSVCLLAIYLKVVSRYLPSILNEIVSTFSKGIILCLLIVNVFGV